MTAATAGAEIYNSQAEDSEDSPTIPPGLAGPTAYAATRSFIATSTGAVQFKEAEFESGFARMKTTLLPNAPDVSPETRQFRQLYYKLAQENARNPGLANDLLFDSSSPLYNHPAAGPVRNLPIEGRIALQNELNVLVRDTTAIRASAIRAAVMDTASRLPTPEARSAFLGSAYYGEPLSLRGQQLTDEQVVTHMKNYLGKYAQSQGLAQNEIDDALKVIVPEMTDRVKNIQTAGLASRAVGRTKRFGSRIFPALTQVLAQLAVDVDVRPVEARVSPTKKNAIIVSHIEDSWTAATLPTIHRLCALDSNGECKEAFYLADACNSDTDACLYSYSLPGRTPDQSYSLLVSVNNPAISSEQLFNSVMLPNTPPIEIQAGASLSVGELTQERISKLRTQETDTGDEKALDRKKVIRNRATSGATSGGSAANGAATGGSGSNG